MSTKNYQRWKKFTKKHRQNFESGKVAHKICAKKPKNRAKMSKKSKTEDKKC